MGSLQTMRTQTVDGGAARKTPRQRQNRRPKSPPRGSTSVGARHAAKNGLKINLQTRAPALPKSHRGFWVTP